MWQSRLVLVCLLWEGGWGHLDQEQGDDRIVELEHRIEQMEARIEKLERVIQQVEPIQLALESEVNQELEIQEAILNEDVGDSVHVPHLDEQTLCSISAAHQCVPSFCDKDSRSRASEIGSPLCSDCTSWDSCPQEGFNCFDGVCLSYLMVMEQVFDFGKGCDTHSDCVQACDQGESPSGHYLANFVKKALNKDTTLGRCAPEPQRAPRLPDNDFSSFPDCKNDRDCVGEDVHCFNNMGSGASNDKRCLTFRQVLETNFLIGKACNQRSDCPEVCYGRTGTCGPALHRK